MRGLFEHASFSANEVRNDRTEKEGEKLKPQCDQWRLSSTLPRRGYKSELLHCAQGIIHMPFFHDLAASIATADADRPNRHLLIGRGDTPKFTFVCASHCKAGRFLVPFDDHVINGEMSVRKRAEDLAHMLFVVLEAAYILASATVKDDVSGVELVHYGHGGRLPLVELLKETTPELLKIFC